MMASILGIMTGLILVAAWGRWQRYQDEKNLADDIADPYKEFPYMKEGIRMAAEQQSRIWKKQSKKGERLRVAKRKALRYDKRKL